MKRAFVPPVPPNLRSSLEAFLYRRHPPNGVIGAPVQGVYKGAALQTT